MAPKIIGCWGSRNPLIPNICGSRVSRSHVPSEHCWVLSATNIPSFNGFRSVNIARFQVGMALSWRNDPKNSREYLGIVLCCSTCFRSCYISPSPPCSLFTSVWASLGHNSRGSDVIWDIAASSSLLSPRHGITSSTWATNSCCNRSPGTWEHSKLIIHLNSGRK